MATPPKHVDRRAQRTRQVLWQAFLEIMQEKGFTAMSIQEVTDRANVHRGTFYAHFADKHTLLETIIREEFRDLLSNTLPPKSELPWEQEILHHIIETTLIYFKNMYRQCPPMDIVDPLVERATQEELAIILVIWLQQNTHIDKGADVCEDDSSTHELDNPWSSNTMEPRY